jgi:hypothetical protein
MAIAQGHIIKPMNWPRVSATINYNMNINEKKKHYEIDLKEETPVR